MKTFAVLAVTAATASAFTPATFGVRSSSGLSMSFDLDYGKNNGYVPASAGDGGQGEFGAVSPSDWRVAGTSPVGQSSYAGAADGGDEPWFAEAVSTVSLDLAKAEETLKAFTKEAAEFKMTAFAEANKLSDKSKAMADLIGAMGYDGFLEANPKALAKAWAKLNPTEEKKEEKKE
mmetsp:Transcript_13751/g.17946  ORF Transcript_13751/g.17946 Transcript_13751/m.17946 type:complete len:176 (+) Transcript_13751:143-670(+)